MDPVVECRAVSRVFTDGAERRVVLDDVSLTVQAGEMLTIVGASGSGKSTLLAALGGLDRDYTGEVRLFGRDLAKEPDPALSRFRGRSVGFVFQSFHLLPHLTAIENVLVPALFGDAIDDAERHAAEALARVGLGGREHDRTEALSGGQRQRVAIARALLAKPPLLLCDEPTGNLDSETAASILALFLELHRAGDTTFVIATHDEHIAEAASRAVVLREGRLQET
ncbi:MAG: ABC transporter ATP-binding protein [Myxococcales bacterium]|nr:ABC transporter ATP-binding protein [Myxococcales bacterium]